MPLTEDNNKKGERCYEKDLCKSVIEIMDFTDDVVMMSGVGTFEVDQPDFLFADNPWGVS